MTDSYHGAYWAALLGRKVAITGAFSTKFSTFPWPIPIIDGTDLIRAANVAKAFPDAYDQAIDATRSFAREVARIE